MIKQQKPSKPLLNIRIDFVFKRVFGDEKNKNVLISFLNAILKGQPYIKSIVVRNAELPQFKELGRGMRLDIHAEINPASKIDSAQGIKKKNQKGSPKEYIDLEIQCYDMPDLADRAVQYLAHMLAEHRDKDDPSSYRNPRAIGIWILSNEYTKFSNPVNRAMMSFEPNEKYGYQVLTDKAQIIFVELTKVKDNDPGLSEGARSWLEFLNNPRNPKIHKVKEIQQAYETLERISEDEKMREMTRMREQFLSGINSALDTLNCKIEQQAQEHRQEMENAKQAYQQQMENVKQVHQQEMESTKRAYQQEMNAKNTALKVLKEAQRKQAIESAKMLLSAHFDKDKVAQATGLSLEEVEALV